MAYEGWLMMGDTEIVNAGRTVELARVMGIDAIRQRRSATHWIEATFEDPGFGTGEFGVGPFGIGDGDERNYRDVREAPWYEPQFDASKEFAGIFPLSVRGLEGSTLEASTTEFVTSGGFSGVSRNASLSIVVDAMVVATSERGAEYGLRWLNRVLRARPRGTWSSGEDLSYFRYPDIGAPIAHRREVRLTRGTSVTMKRTKDCSTLWRVTFTLTAGDPFEYGESVPVLSDLGGTPIFYGPNDNINLVRDASGHNNGSWVGDHTFVDAGNPPPPAHQNGRTLRLPLDGVYRQTQEPLFNVTAGDVYSLSAQGWVSPDVIQGEGDPGNVWFAIHFWDVQDNYIAGAGVLWTLADAGDGWITRVNPSVTVPENAVTARVRIRTNGGLNNGAVFVDDLRVFRVKSGTRTDLMEFPCAQPDYAPLQDPAYPSLLAPPASPNLVPDGWIVRPGLYYSRYWARVEPIRPSTLLVVPTFTIVTTTGAWRGLRLSLWPSSVSTDSRCDPLFSIVLNYVPPNSTLFIDGERQAVYTWGGEDFVRRADSIAFSPEMGPVQWTSLNSDQALLVTMDTFSGTGSARVSLSLTPKSD